MGIIKVLLIADLFLFALDDSCVGDVIETRKVALKIRIATLKEWTLLASPDAAASRFAILGVQRIRHIHTFDNPAERRKRFRIMSRRIVPQIDEDLRRSTVRHGEG